MPTDDEESMDRQRDARPGEDHRSGEREPLLRSQQGASASASREILSFREGDTENPRQWSRRTKMINVFVIALMAILSPLASSMFTPGIQQIADGLDTDEATVIACTTGFVVMLGIGPLLHAPLSETFGRRRVYLVCFSIFSLLQIPSALAPNIEVLIAMRTLSGFFGSVSVANGGGSISDMFDSSERAGVFGWYLLGPLLGPTIGPLAGGVIVQRLGWRWVFWILAVVCTLNTVLGYIFLRETYAPVILARRKETFETAESSPGKYGFDGEDTRPLHKKLATSLTRPFRILIQPIVLTMSIYQAIIFATTYSIYTNMQPIYAGIYGFNTEQVGLLYLGPGLGFLLSVKFIIPHIDTVRNALVRRNEGISRPEFRLPLANIGAVLLPLSLFIFAWTINPKIHWFVSIASTFFYGLGMITILNTVQNYYIDSFETWAASAIAAGAVFRAVVGGVIPLFAPGWFENLGYGWGISIFAFSALLLAPAPAVFYYYGQKIREGWGVDVGV